jgi:hypothetical protein
MVLVDVFTFLVFLGKDKHLLGKGEKLKEISPELLEKARAAIHLVARA